MMHIFLTGATGVIGRRVIPMLVERGHRVTAAVRSPDRFPIVTALGARARVVDLFDAAAVRLAVEGHDTVINLATHIPATSRMLLPGAWRENDRLRRDASRHLADAAIAAGAERFVQESFGLTYPDGGSRWVDERVPLEPVGHTHTVLDAERAAARVTAEGRTGIALRFAGLYGPDAMMRDMLAAVRKGWSPLPGRPDAFFSSLSQHDAASAVVAALRAPAGTYNVVDDAPMPRAEWVGSLARKLGVDLPRTLPGWTTSLLGSAGNVIARSLRLSNRALKDATGWTPRFASAADGWDWVLEELEAAKAA